MKTNSLRRGVLFRLLCLLCVICMTLGSCVTRGEAPGEEEPDTPTHVLHYTVNDPDSGTIIGETEQQLAAGQGSATVCAVPEPGYVFSGWSDGVQSDIRQNDMIEKDTKITANFTLDVQPLELPMIYLTTENEAEITSKTEYLAGTITVSNTEEEYLLTQEALEIRGRGNSSWRMEKKSYRIKLNNARNLLGTGQGPAKDWTLIANYSDQSLLRNYTAYSLSRQLSGIAYTTGTRFVEVFVNGEYEGVYLLCEQVEVSPFRVNVAKDSSAVDTGYLLELDNRSSEYDENCFLIRGVPYVIQSDIYNDEQLEFIRNYMQQTIDAIYGGDETTIRSYVDIDSLVDIYILQEYLKNIDSGFASFYMYKDTGGKLYFGPAWDFDIAAGNDRNLDEGGYQGIYNQNQNLNVSTVHPNPILCQMISYGWFEDLVIARWFEISDIIDGVIQDVPVMAEANEGAFARNFLRWKILGTREQVYHEPNSILILNTYEEHVEYLYNWLRDRKNWLDQYYAQRRVIRETEQAVEQMPASTTDTAVSADS